MSDKGCVFYKEGKYMILRTSVCKMFIVKKENFIHIIEGLHKMNKIDWLGHNLDIDKSSQCKSSHYS